MSTPAVKWERRGRHPSPRSEDSDRGARTPSPTSCSRATPFARPHVGPCTGGCRMRLRRLRPRRGRPRTRSDRRRHRRRRVDDPRAVHCADRRAGTNASARRRRRSECDRQTGRGPARSACRHRHADTRTRSRRRARSRTGAGLVADRRFRTAPEAAERRPAERAEDDRGPVDCAGSRGSARRPSGTAARPAAARDGRCRPSASERPDTPAAPRGPGDTGAPFAAAGA